MKEIWKNILGYEGLYQISSIGRVKSVTRISFNRRKIINERILRPSFERRGYAKVVLSKSGILKTHKVHRLLAITFIPNPENKPMINHIDCNPSNNCLNNLEWCTNIENCLHAIKMGRVKINPLKKKPTLSRGKHMAGKINELHWRSKKVYQYDINWNLINVWPSVNELKRSGFLTDTWWMSKLCQNNHKKPFKNSFWRYDMIDK